MKIRNVNPLGEMEVLLLNRIVAFGEEVEATAEQAAELISTGNFEAVEAASAKPKKEN